MAFLASCSGSQGLSAYDDVYYSPKDDEPIAVDSDYDYVDIDDREPEVDYKRNEPVEDDYYDSDRSRSAYSEEEGRTVVNNYYGRNYEDDDYYYSSRYRRFNRWGSGFDYYDPYYAYSNWNSYDSYFWRPLPYRPYYHRPGWGFSWNNHFGWTMGFSAGWGNYYPYGGYTTYNPWSYYGNVYCPPYSAGGYYGNDFYYNSAPVYSGQYNSLSSYSSSSSTNLGSYTRSQVFEGMKPGEAQYAPVDVKPVMSPNSEAKPNPSSPVKPDTRPVNPEAKPTDVRPSEKPGVIAPQDRPNGTRPVDKPEDFRPGIESKPRPDGPSTKPAAKPEPREYYSPTEDSKPSDGGSPIFRKQRDSQRTQPNLTPAPKKRNRSYTPSPSRTQSRSTNVRGSSPSRNSGIRPSSSGAKKSSPSKRR